MKALTVKQPWAAVIASGRKKIENRTWPTSHRGPLAIHAGKTPSADARELMEHFDLDPAAVTYGAVVAIVNVVDCVALDDLPPELRDDPFAEGPFCWLLSEARIITPIHCKGQLGLWNCPNAGLTRRTK
jgi:ASCH domain